MTGQGTNFNIMIVLVVTFIEVNKQTKYILCPLGLKTQLVP